MFYGIESGEWATGRDTFLGTTRIDVLDSSICDINFILVQIFLDRNFKSLNGNELQQVDRVNPNTAHFLVGQEIQTCD